RKEGREGKEGSQGVRERGRRKKERKKERKRRKEGSQGASLESNLDVQNSIFAPRQRQRAACCLLVAFQGPSKRHLEPFQVMAVDLWRAHGVSWVTLRLGPFVQGPFVPLFPFPKGAPASVDVDRLPA
ncbi:Intestine-specific homeobox, partial [Ophiophagus hannah]